MDIFICTQGCCKLKAKHYIHEKDLHYKIRKKRLKAGVFIHDPVNKKILLIQSRGNLWGPPKGTLEFGETEIEGSKREVLEETGLKISERNFTNKTVIQNRASYFYMETSECDVDIQEHVKGNDANGIGWIKPECLKTCIINGNISITHHCRIIFKRFLTYEFPYSNFTLVTKRKGSKYKPLNIIENI